MMLQLEQRFGGVCGGQRRRDLCLLTQSLNRWGFRTSPPADRLSRRPRFIVQHSWRGRLAGLCMCMQYLLHPNWQPISGRPAQRDRAFPSQIE